MLCLYSGCANSSDEHIPYYSAKKNCLPAENKKTKGKKELDRI
jgi:hypothetical protein